jgi:hypothetical protein
MPRVNPLCAGSRDPCLTMDQAEHYRSDRSIWR